MLLGLLSNIAATTKISTAEYTYSVVLFFHFTAY